MADFVTTVGFDDTQVDAGLQNINRKFSTIGTSLSASTAGVRKLSGAITSTAGVVTGMLGVFGLIAGAIGGIVALVNRWDRKQEEINNRIRESRKRLSEIVEETDRLGQPQELFAAEFEDALRRIDELSEGWFRLSHAEREARLVEQDALQDRIRRIQQLREEQRKLEESKGMFDRQKREGEILREMQQQTEERARLRREEEQIAEMERERLRLAKEAAEREAEDIRFRVEQDNLRARGLEDQADALERQRDLQRTIKEIEESEGLSPAERRELIDRAKETAMLQAQAAREQKSAGVTPEGAAGTPGALSLAAGFGGNEVLTRQALGAGGSATEQQQLTTQRQIAAFVRQISETFDRLRNQPRILV